MLRLEDVTAGYGRGGVLHGVNLQVDDGKMTVLLGANGAGKTTLLRSISGLLSRQGVIEFDGKHIEKSGAVAIAKMGIAHCVEGRGTFTELTVEENLLVGAYTLNDKSETSRNRAYIEELFPIIRQRAKQRAGMLSGGEQQMLAIGRALMMSPRILLLDEPSLGLAPTIVEQVYQALRKIIDSKKVGMLVVEQHAAVALRVADYVYTIETGYIKDHGKPDDMVRDDRIRNAYIG